MHQFDVTNRFSGSNDRPTKSFKRSTSTEYNILPSYEAGSSQDANAFDFDSRINSDELMAMAKQDNGAALSFLPLHDVESVLRRIDKGVSYNRFDVLRIDLVVEPKVNIKCFWRKNELQMSQRGSSHVTWLHVIPADYDSRKQKKLRNFLEADMVCTKQTHQIEPFNYLTSSSSILSSHFNHKIFL